MIRFVKTFSVLSAVLITGCLAGEFTPEGEDLGSIGGAATTAIVSCDELQESCEGKFICYDEAASADGRCLTAGTCVTESATAGVEPDEIDCDGGDGTATAGIEGEDIDCSLEEYSRLESCEIKYGPVITIKPKG